MWTDALSNLLLGAGTMVSGTAAILAVRARRRAETAARTVNPDAVFAELRTQVSAVVSAHDESATRWRENNAAMELVLRAERRRADEAQKETFGHLAGLASLRVDLAEAQLEIRGLRTDLDRLTAGRVVLMDRPPDPPSP